MIGPTTIDTIRNICGLIASCTFVIFLAFVMIEKYVKKVNEYFYNHPDLFFTIILILTLTLCICVGTVLELSIGRSFYEVPREMPDIVCPHCNEIIG